MNPEIGLGKVRHCTLRESRDSYQGMPSGIPRLVKNSFGFSKAALNSATLTAWLKPCPFETESKLCYATIDC